MLGNFSKWVSAVSKGRRMSGHRGLREAVLWSTILGAVAVIGGFGWMTRQPQHRFFDRLSKVPVVGILVDQLRRPHLEARRAQRLRREKATRDQGVDSEGAERATIDSEWIGIGANLYRQPVRGSVVSLTTRLANYEVRERRGSWVEVVLPDGQQVWVDRSEAHDPTPPLGEAPEPPRPLPSRAVDEELLERAIGFFEGPPQERMLATYSLVTDLPDSGQSEALLLLLDLALRDLEETYTKLYDVVPLGNSAETIVLYRSQGSYRELLAATSGLRGGDISGHTTLGLVALAVGERRSWEVKTTLVHEVTHLLNRRALGPVLPPWLSEGLATHLALLGTAERPELDDRYRRVEGDTIHYSGSLASLRVLRERAEQHQLLGLAALAATPEDEFLSDHASLLYAQSAFWIDQLLKDPVDRPALQAFLRSVAAGKPATGEALRSRLARPWTELDHRFAAWLGDRAGEARVDGF